MAHNLARWTGADRSGRADSHHQDPPAAVLLPGRTATRSARRLTLQLLEKFSAPWPGCEPFHSRPDGTGRLRSGYSSSQLDGRLASRTSLPQMPSYRRCLPRGRCTNSHLDSDASEHADHVFLPHPPSNSDTNLDADSNSRDSYSDSCTYPHTHPTTDSRIHAHRDCHNRSDAASTAPSLRDGDPRGSSDFGRHSGWRGIF